MRSVCKAHYNSLSIIKIELIMKYSSEVLKIKITLGYILLAPLFALIVYLVSTIYFPEANSNFVF